MNTRNDDVDPDALAWTGRYIQALVNRRVPLPSGGVWFGDETDTWVKGQEATTPERLPNGEPLVNGSAGFARHDVDRDGCIDLVMVRQGQRPSRHAPLVYLNNGSGQFLPMSAEPFLRADMYFGDNAAPTDVNGDGAVDFVEVELHEGPDGVIHTGDDVAIDRHATRRLRQWLCRKHKVRTGKKCASRLTDSGLITGSRTLAPRTASFPWAKA